MWLENFPNIRIKEYRKGFVVEIQKKKWYGKKYWTHIISVNGIKEQPWYYKSEQMALNEVSKFFRWTLINNHTNQ